MHGILKRALILATGALLTGVASAAPAAATTLVGLTGERTLVVIDHGKRKVIRTIGAKVPGRLLGIDARPADGKLYGLVSDGSVVTIDIRTGAAGSPVRLSVPLSAASGFAVDFNPALDRLRVVGSDNTNLNVDVTTGTTVTQTPLTYAAGNPLGGTTPKVTAIAYSNNRPGTKTTLLYDYDEATNGLYLQLPPPSGVLAPVGTVLGVSQTRPVGFDILTDRRSRNWGLFAAQGKIFQIDLAGGAAFSSYVIRAIAKTPLRDLAALPFAGRFGN